MRLVGCAWVVTGFVVVNLNLLLKPPRYVSRFPFFFFFFSCGGGGGPQKPSHSRSETSRIVHVISTTAKNDQEKGAGKKKERR